MTAPAAYPHLFRPLQAGPIQLANRLVMGSMHMGLEGQPEHYGRLGRFHADRVRGGAGLIVTGGHSPNGEGNLGFHPAEMITEADAQAHRAITGPVKEAGGRIVLQLLHAGRYGYHPNIVAPSAIRAPINPTVPRELTDAEVERTIQDFGRAAQLALQAGYDGVEVMGSEGYLITQFLGARTNHRQDRWGGPFQNRLAFPVEIVRAVRRAAGPGCLIVYRISALDLVEGGLDQEEILAVARAVEAAGADLLDTGIGWHEAQIPTIAQAVPPAGFAWATERLKRAVGIPVMATNRINTPEIGEGLLADGTADLISMARPWLADAEFGAKAQSGDRRSINVCIACNQACLDHTFAAKPASCLVNPAAGREADLAIPPTAKPLSLAVIGGGPAGLSAAEAAARAGHRVTLYEASDRLGGQFNLAKRIPGKDVFQETIDYFSHRLDRLGATVRLGQAATAQTLRDAGHDHVIIASGVTPRRPDIPGIAHPSVVSYVDLLTGAKAAGRRVAVIGGGGIGFDVSIFLTEGTRESATQVDRFNGTWGIDPAAGPGGVTTPRHGGNGRRITMLKRSEGRFGKGLGKTTGWILRSELKRSGVEQIAGVAYERIDDDGLHIRVGADARVIACDTVVLCAGQDSLDALSADLVGAGIGTTVIGGAKLAAELDAKRAIEDGLRAVIALG